MVTVNEGTTWTDWAEIHAQQEARKEAAMHYLDAPDTMARFREQLLAALCDPAFSSLPNRQFDWSHFVREFTAPDFDPPLTLLEFFENVLRPHFRQPGWYTLPRSRIWWLIRLVFDVEDPIAWLREQRKRGKGTFVQIARALNCPGVTNVHLSRYLLQQSRAHKPRIPERFKVEGTRLLALVDDYYNPGVWGLECRPFGRWPLAWRVIFAEKTKRLPSGEQPPPREQSPQAIIESVLERHDFQPSVILFYTYRSYVRETGRLRWGKWLSRREMEQLGIDSTHGPVLVEGWDEEGWPIGRRIPLEEEGES